MNNEFDFLKGINQHKISAYKILYKEYYKLLVLYSVNFVEHLNIAEDIVQGLFASIWEKQTTFISLSSFRVYLYNSVKNASLDYLKHLNVEKKYIASPEHTLGEVSTEQICLEEEIRRLLYKEIDNLPYKMRKIFLLYMRGKKNEEIAAMLNISIETVKTQKKRALKHIKSKFVPLIYLFPIIGAIQ